MSDENEFIRAYAKAYVMMCKKYGDDNQGKILAHLTWLVEMGRTNSLNDWIEQEEMKR